MAALRFTPSKLDIAKDWLKAALADGPHTASELQAKAQAEGIKVRTLQLAAREIAEIKPQFGAHGVVAWQWRLK